MLLELNNVNVFIKKVQVLRNVSLNVNREEIVCIVGRNGAGKTTTIKSVLGLVSIKEGSIKFMERDITRLPTQKRVKLGIGYAPEDRRIFPDLTAEENIDIAARLLDPSKRKEVKEIIFKIFPELKKLLDRKGLYLSGGEQKMLAIARALAISPQIVLLDEPLEGLAPLVVSRLIRAIKEVKDLGISVLVAESNIARISELAERIYVIERGEIIFEGTPEEVQENKDVMRIIRGF